MSSSAYKLKVLIGIVAVVLLLLLLYVIPIGVLMAILIVFTAVMAGEVLSIGFRASPLRTILVAMGMMILIGAGIIGMVDILVAAPYGPSEFLALGVIIIVTDTVAQVAGRKWGKSGTFLPKVSPGKSRIGAIAGLVSGLAVAAGLIVAVVLGAPLFTRTSLAVTVCVLVAAPILSIAGDLYASYLKRRSGVKDYAHYIPGTGGVLDRLDSWLPVFALALILV